MAAQAAAVLEALEEGRDVRPRIGYLVGVREARLNVSELPVGPELRVRVRVAGSAPPLRTYDVEVSTETGTEVLRGNISTYAPDAE
jgi:predicted hotdog family 3-hydroxylacyl-ACP dehydratase